MAAHVLPTGVGFAAIFSGRTPFFDDSLMRYVDAGVRQVVILGAAWTARAP